MSWISLPMICKNSCTPSPTCELFLVIHRTIVVSWHSLWRIFDFQQNQTPIKFCRAMIHLFGFAGTRGAPLLSLSVIGLRKLDCCFASRGFLIWVLKPKPVWKKLKNLLGFRVQLLQYATLTSQQPRWANSWSLTRRRSRPPAMVVSLLPAKFRC